MPSQLSTLNSLAVLKRRRLDGKESEAVNEKRRCIDSSHHSDWSDDDWSDPDPGWIESELDRQYWEAQELAREAHDLEFMLCWEQELQELGHKAWQSRRLTEHIIEDHAEFCRSCTPRMLATELDRQYWEAQELAREAHDLEFMSRNSPGIHL